MPLRPLVDELLKSFRVLHAKTTFVLEVPAHITLRADRHALRQVILNLLDNAVKFGPAEQTVTVSAVAESGRTNVRVSDQGPGIPASDRNHVWETFYRGESATGSGSGIGLAVARELVEAMGGGVQVEDNTNGATISFWLASGEV